MIVTIGGILGRWLHQGRNRADLSGSANTKLRVTKSAIQANLTAQEKARERAAAQAQATQAAKEEKARAKAEAKKARRGVSALPPDNANKPCICSKQFLLHIQEVFACPAGGRSKWNRRA